MNLAKYLSRRSVMQIESPNIQVHKPIPIGSYRDIQIVMDPAMEEFRQKMIDMMAVSSETIVMMGRRQGKSAIMYEMMKKMALYGNSRVLVSPVSNEAVNREAERINTSIHDDLINSLSYAAEFATRGHPDSLCPEVVPEKYQEVPVGRKTKLIKRNKYALS